MIDVVSKMMHKNKNAFRKMNENHKQSGQLRIRRLNGLVIDFLLGSTDYCDM